MGPVRCLLFKAEPTRGEIRIQATSTPTSTKVKVIPLISKEEIEAKVSDLAAQISTDYKDKNPILIGILNGAFIFLADLIRKLDISCECDFFGVASYGSSTETSGILKITKDLTTSIEGRDVIIIEDIVDTGLTLKCIQKTLKLEKVNSIRVCALLDKKERREIEVEIDYLGFSIPNKFVVGYGIDYNERYRNLSFIGYLDFEAK